MMWTQLNGAVRIPSTSEALLFDLDGVLIDSLQLDVEICTALLKKHHPSASAAQLPRDYLQTIFALDIESFWRRILADANMVMAETDFARLLNEYHGRRISHPFPLTPGVESLLSCAKQASYPMAVVSNNATEDVKKILTGVGIADYFSTVVGNDQARNGALMKKKPAPDTYLHAAEVLGASPNRCVVFEDSEIGVQAGISAGCFIVGLGTGSATLSELQKCIGTYGEVYSSLLERGGSE